MFTPIFVFLIKNGKLGKVGYYLVRGETSLWLEAPPLFFFNEVDPLKFNFLSLIIIF